MKPRLHYLLTISVLCRLSFLFITSLLSGCDRAITVVPVPYVGKISIQSLITPDQIPTVYINRTVPYFDGRVLAGQLFLRSAQVTISSSAGSEVLRADSVFNPIRCELAYFFRGRLPVQANQTYTLTVRVDGATYSASATTNQHKVNIDKLGYVTAFTDIYGAHEGLVFTLIDPPGKGDYYRYDMSRIIADTIISVQGPISYCSIGKPTFIREIGRAVYTDATNDGTAITFTAEPGYNHRKNQVGYARLQIIDKAMYDFYDNLDRQKGAQYNPFVEPVFLKKPGQFGPNAFGVFGAYAVSDSVRFVFPE